MSFDLPTTRLHHFGPLARNNQRLFSVRTGTNADDALAHASLLLGYAGAIAYEAADCDGVDGKLLARGVIPLIDAAKALVDACTAG